MFALCGSLKCVRSNITWESNTHNKGMFCRFLCLSFKMEISAILWKRKIGKKIRKE